VKYLIPCAAKLVRCVTWEGIIPRKRRNRVRISQSANSRPAQALLGADLENRQPPSYADFRESMLRNYSSLYTRVIARCDADFVADAGDRRSSPKRLQLLLLW